MKLKQVRALMTALAIVVGTALCVSTVSWAKSLDPEPIPIINEQGEIVESNIQSDRTLYFGSTVEQDITKTILQKLRTDKAIKKDSLTAKDVSITLKSELVFDEEKNEFVESENDIKDVMWSYVKKKYKLNVTNFLCSERSLTCYFYCILLDVFKILFLIFIWRQISTMTVNAHGIVKCFDVFKNQFMCMCIIKDFKPVDPFSLQKCMERFYTGVIPWICFL